MHIVREGYNKLFDVALTEYYLNHSCDLGLRYRSSHLCRVTQAMGCLEYTHWRHLMQARYHLHKYHLCSEWSFPFFSPESLFILHELGFCLGKSKRWDLFCLDLFDLLSLSFLDRGNGHDFCSYR